MTSHLREVVLHIHTHKYVFDHCNRIQTSFPSTTAVSSSADDDDWNGSLFVLLISLAMETEREEERSFMMQGCSFAT